MDFLKFDTPKFIAEIEKRPAIWKKYLFQSDYSKKLQQWSEIVDIYKGNEDLSSADYDKLEQQLRQKWRNVRDSFVKTHKAKLNNQDTVRNKKSFYAFYNNLLFLERENEDIYTVQNKCTQSGIKCERRSENESDSDSDDSSSSFQKSKWSRTFYTEQIESTENDALNEDASGSAGFSKENNILEDGDRLFFLSLVKEFKKIPDEKQIQAKLDILKVIQNAQR